MVKNTVSVQMDYFSRGVVNQYKVSVFLQRAHNPEKLALSFTFPEFNYTRFVYKGVLYFLCADRSGMGQNFICVLPERARFMSIDRGDMVTLNHFASIGGDKFKLIANNYAGRIVLLQGPLDGFSQIQAPLAGTEKTVTTSAADTIVSDQVGFKAPLIQGKNMNPLMKKGGQVSTAGLKGKYIFVDFWSTYCAPCIEELPYLKAAYDKYKRDVFEIVGVFDERAPGLTKKIFEANKVTWPTVGMNSKDAEISGYGHVQSFPTNYLIDPSGRIIAFNLRSEDLMNRLKELIGH
ncbi:TlpA family protein disulfide reductase [Mucilaginibacter terrigena]|uniref:TlpA family protein disulfide reductase n=2 Tax=Mucilaginibacter terrigena TaxID=2492395 RepID=A0A4Q5LSS7_9SPHI|nr:TlpA family protein disulfide reductase [Mucilaginibacter terrigena]